MAETVWPVDGMLSPDGTSFIDATGAAILNLHPAEACAGRHCVIHNPSEHSMRKLPLVWRTAGLFDIKPSHFERICEHGVGHPDPDSVAYMRNLGIDISSHGCCGCCFDADEDAQ